MLTHRNLAVFTYLVLKMGVSLQACFISKLRIGDKIGQLTSIGTLGGFVRYLGFECFLTCAHVMYDVQTLLGSSSDCAD
jgi:hypothetical protein